MDAMEKINTQTYFDEVRSLAAEVTARAEEGEDPYDVAHELVDGHQWIIYTAYNHVVMWHTDNRDAIDEVCRVEDYGSSFREALMRAAYFALLADVMEHAE